MIKAVTSHEIGDLESLLCMEGETKVNSWEGLEDSVDFQIVYVVQDSVESRWSLSAANFVIIDVVHFIRQLCGQSNF